ncbi:MAG: mannitol dehydrogenase family protein [Saccharofermentanales bacterium]
MNILLFGAGASGRGHLSIQIRKLSDDYITYVDINSEMIEDLNKAGRYKVRLLSLDSSERFVTIDNYAAIDRKNEDAITESFIKADLVLTCVIAENLEDVSYAIAKGIEKRMSVKIDTPLNVIACENLNNASQLLEKQTMRHLGENCASYASEFIGFPDAMISCVVPVPKDYLNITAEDYNEWVVRKSKFKGNADDFRFLDVIHNFDAYLERKLWIHNGGHATVAYAGIRKGYETIHDAISDNDIATFSVSVMHQIGDAVIHKYSFDFDETREYEANFCRRGMIAEMKDSLARVVRDPLRKLGISDRLMGPALYAYENGLPYENILKSLVNVTLYKNDEDPEAVRMENDIKQNGFEKFCETTLGLKNYPDFIIKFAELRKDVQNGTC